MSSASSLECTIPCAFLTKGIWYLSIKTEKSDGFASDFLKITSSGISFSGLSASKYIKTYCQKTPALAILTKTIIYCFGVCLKKSEPILRRTLIDRLRFAPAERSGEAEAVNQG